MSVNNIMSQVHALKISLRMFSIHKVKIERERERGKVSLLIPGMSCHLCSSFFGIKRQLIWCCQVVQARRTLLSCILHFKKVCCHCMGKQFRENVLKNAQVDIFHSKMSRTAVIHQTFTVFFAVCTFSIVCYMADKSTRQGATVNKNP